MNKNPIGSHPAPKYTRAIVRPPGESLVNGITSAGLGAPDYALALKQHAAYVAALEALGLEVRRMEPADEFPDATFVEDTALLTTECAIITRPGAESRRGETASIETVVRDYYQVIERIEAPDTVDAGDVKMVGKHFYIGNSQRTTVSGAKQMILILEKYGMTGSIVPLSEMLHLKSGISYIENNTMVLAGEFVERSDFADFNRVIVDEDESYAANCVWINGHVLVAAGFPKLQEQLESLGYRTISLDVSEFQKVDGGLSCLSLRF